MPNAVKSKRDPTTAAIIPLLHPQRFLGPYRPILPKFVKRFPLKIEFPACLPPEMKTSNTV